MQTVEDALGVLAHLHLKAGLFIIEYEDEWAERFITNVNNHVTLGRPLSSEQSKIVLKLVRRVRDFLIEHGESPTRIDDLLARPVHRQAVYQSSVMPKEVRYLGDNKLGFRFKYNDIIIGDIKALVPREPTYVHDRPWFHRDYNIWVVSVTRDSIDRIMNLIQKHRFDFDEGVIEYLALADNSKGLWSAFAYDPEIEVIAAQVNNNELVAWWSRYVVGGECL